MNTIDFLYTESCIVNPVFGPLLTRRTARTVRGALTILIADVFRAAFAIPAPAGPLPPYRSLLIHVGAIVSAYLMQSVQLESVCVASAARRLRHTGPGRSADPAMPMMICSPSVSLRHCHLGSLLR
jgi:hypothetical protein